MRAISLRLLAALGLAAVLWGCEDEKEDLQVETATDYINLQPGKYITYRLDSTVFPQAGRSTETHSYQEKHVIDAQFLDNQGRQTYRVFRYIRNVAGTGNWSAAGTYMITPLTNSIEVIEDNMRVVKLVTPIKEGNSWKGNRYLTSEPYAPLYNFANDNTMTDWEFTYESTSDVFKYNQQELSNVVRVLQVDERLALDTVDVASNQANLPKDSDGVWLRGSATDTIVLNVPAPSAGTGQLTIYNQTNKFAKLNNIVIPPGLALYYEYRDGKWFYPNPLAVANNKVALPPNALIAYLTGNNATDSIKVDFSKLDTNQVRRVKVYNKNVKDAYPFYNTTLLSALSIPPGLGRTYELKDKQWVLASGASALLDKDPYIDELPFGTTSYGVEKYAKGVGMVYQELLLWEHQPNPGGTPYKVGFGVKRTMIDHN